MISAKTIYVAFFVVVSDSDAIQFVRAITPNGDKLLKGSLF